jgi:hypothetical protein
MEKTKPASAFVSVKSLEMSEINGERLNRSRCTFSVARKPRDSIMLWLRFVGTVAPGLE